MSVSVEQGDLVPEWPRFVTIGTQENPRHPDKKRNWPEYRVWYDAEYQHTDHHRQMRLYKLFYQGSVCELCGAEGPVELHHNDYRNTPYREHPEQINLLCRACHGQVTFDPSHSLNYRNAQEQIVKDHKATTNLFPHPLARLPQSVSDHKGINEVIEQCLSYFATKEEVLSLAMGLSESYLRVRRARPSIGKTPNTRTLKSINNFLKKVREKQCGPNYFNNMSLLEAMAWSGDSSPSNRDGQIGPLDNAPPRVYAPTNQHIPPSPDETALAEAQAWRHLVREPKPKESLWSRIEVQAAAVTAIVILLGLSAVLALALVVEMGR